jgi:hypothetical protein
MMDGWLMFLISTLLPQKLLLRGTWVDTRPEKDNNEEAPWRVPGLYKFFRGAMVEMMGMNPGPGMGCQIGVRDDIFTLIAHRLPCKCKR